MERTELMVALETALADVAGLLETSIHLAGAGADAAFGDDEKRQAVKRQLAEAADVYLSIVLSSAGGELTEERITRCRVEAEARMPEAVAMEDALRRLVSAKRLPLADWQNDLAQLALLSLELRQQLKELAAAETFDDKAADPAANKVLVHLREATLAYLRSARLVPYESADDNTRPRDAALDELDKANQHVAALVTLEDQSAERVGTMVTPAAALRRSVGEPLRKVAQEWHQPEP